MPYLLPKSNSQRRFLFVAATVLIVGVIYLRFRHNTEGFQTKPSDNLSFLTKDEKARLNDTEKTELITAINILNSNPIFPKLEGNDVKSMYKSMNLRRNKQIPERVKTLQALQQNLNSNIDNTINSFDINKYADVKNVASAATEKYINVINALKPKYSSLTKQQKNQLKDAINYSIQGVISNLSSTSIKPLNTLKKLSDMSEASAIIVVSQRLLKASPTAASS